MPASERGSAEVLAALQRAIKADADDLIARHNLGVELRRLDRPHEALAALDEAIRRGIRAPETRVMRAHLLADLGRFDEAVAQYREVLEAAPELVDAHETLSRLLPQLGRGGEALDAYRRALAKAPRAGLLWVSALGTAQALHEHAQLLEWSMAAERVFGRDPIIDTFAATALSALDDDAAARTRLEQAIAAHPDFQPARLTLAHVLVRTGAIREAEAEASHVVSHDFQNQSAWALLSTIWRLTGDAREEWLADYERLVMPIDITGIDLGDFAARLDGMHAMVRAPAEQSLRGGTQTRGNLFDRHEPTIEALADAIRGGVSARLAGLPKDDSHPFLSRNTGDIAFQGSWSVRLASEGFHISHIHPAGWLSSAFYVSLPAEVADSANSGALAFGVPDAALKIDLPPRRVVAARAGRLVVFPSYLWHGTLPFESSSPRLTVAFDALPVDRGSPNR